MDFWNFVKSWPLFSLLETSDSIVAIFGVNLLLLLASLLPPLLRLFRPFGLPPVAAVVVDGVGAGDGDAGDGDADVGDAGDELMMIFTNCRQIRSWTWTTLRVCAFCLVRFPPRSCTLG